MNAQKKRNAQRLQLTMKNNNEWKIIMNSLDYEWIVKMLQMDFSVRR